MHPHIPEFAFNDLPPAFFPDDAIAVPDLPLARASVSLPLVALVPEQEVTRRALRIVRAKTGESEMRLLAQATEGGDVTYIVRASTLNPVKNEDKLLQKNGKPMNEAKARASFERMVAARYPAITLRKNVTVPVHLDLL